MGKGRGSRTLVALLAGASVVVASIALGSGAGSAARSPRVATAYERHLASEVNQPIPARNLYALADQLVLRPPRRILKVVRRTSPNYSVGHQDNFWVLSEDNLKFFRMTATIRAKTAHLYFYVQNGTNVSQAGILQAAHIFETKTYPTDRRLFGSEWRPGVDGDPHITCLLGDLQSSDIAGAYSAEDEYPTAVNPYSNQRELFYINSNTLPGTTDFDLTLAHEFQHMIHWHVHQHDNAWLNEGMSVLAQHLNHYSTSGYPDAFFANPSTQLESWEATADNSAHYGAAYLFLAYIYDHYGEAMIHTLENDGRYTDLALINDGLRKRHAPLTADQLFGNWVVANVARARSGLYGYPESSAVRVASESLPLAVSSSLPPYAARYFSLSNLNAAKPFRLSFSGTPVAPLVGVSSSQPFWWSNRGDMSDTRLERTVDLRRVHHAHLHFRLWYQIEDGYDFGYVEASADRGRTWTTLPGLHTTRDKRTGANYGSGYTGSSKGWVNENINLSRFGGKEIRLRFEYVTDDEVNQQGMLVKNISIPEIGFRDDLSGWSAHGFVPVLDNFLPALWHVRLIAKTASGLKVSSIRLDSTQSGSITVNPSQEQISKLTLAVYFVAPKTTVRIPFKVTTSG